MAHALRALCCKDIKHIHLLAILSGNYHGSMLHACVSSRTHRKRVVSVGLFTEFTYTGLQTVIKDKGADGNQ